MGLTIHYSGALDNPAQVGELSLKMRLLCQELGWPCRTINQRILGQAEHLILHHVEDPGDGIPTTFASSEYKPIDDRLRGVFIAPPETEPLILTFNREGRLIHYWDFDSSIEQSHDGLSAAILPLARTYYVQESFHVKTTGHVETHVQITDLLRYLKTHFLSNLEVTDEGQYWETNDRQLLATEHAKMERILAMMSDPKQMRQILEEVGMLKPDDPDPTIQTNVTISLEQPEPDESWGIATHEN